MRFNHGSLDLTTPLADALVQGLERPGFTVERPGSLLEFRELAGTRFTVYNPVEIGDTAPLWDALDPETSIWIGALENQSGIRDVIAFFAGQADAAGDRVHQQREGICRERGLFRGACRSLAGAAQVLGRIRLRAEIVSSCGAGGEKPRPFSQFRSGTEAARDRIDAL